MSFSVNYSEVYDLLHDSKAYPDEARFVFDMVSSSKRSGPKSVLDLACGTGRHLAEFARMGLAVHANDLSAGMLGVAKARLESMGAQSASTSNLPMQDLKGPLSARPQGFDLATAFYTTIGYVVEPEALDRFFRNLKTLMAPGAYLFADFWNGHRMSRDFSPTRTRDAQNDQIKVKRVSRVAHVPEKNALRVCFDFEVTPLRGGDTQRFTEEHMVRYHWPLEITNLLMAHGFEVVKVGPFLGSKDAHETLSDCWNFFALARLLP